MSRLSCLHGDGEQLTSIFWFSQILFINLFAGSSIGHLLTTKRTHLQRKWDLFKALQHFMYQRNELIPELKALCSSDSLEAFSFEDLLLRQHVLSLLASVAQQEFEPASKGTEQETPHNWCAELARTTDFMCKCLVSSTLESWLKGRWDGTVNSSGKILSQFIVITTSVL